MRYRIERSCRLRYAAAAREHHLQISVVPWDDARQSLHRIEIEVTPSTPVNAGRDGFGNLVHHFAVLGTHSHTRGPAAR